MTTLHHTTTFTGNTGIVPPWLTKPADKGTNTGIVPPWMTAPVVLTREIQDEPGDVTILPVDPDDPRLRETAYQPGGAYDPNQTLDEAVRALAWTRVTK